MTRGLEVSDRWNSNPLLRGIVQVTRRVATFREKARKFYHAVLLSAHPCPNCEGSLRMTGPSKCVCRCGTACDPTVAFQRSDCCGVRLRRKTLHYICSSCGRTVPSKFLFDERLFDSAYFAERMRESRERKQTRRQEITEMLASSRSGALCITDIPEIESVAGLASDLDLFVDSMPDVTLSAFQGRDTFRMADYRQAILDDVPAGCLIRFNGMRALCDDARLDRIRRFITLVFMEQAREVELLQEDHDIMVEVYETN